MSTAAAVVDAFIGALERRDIDAAMAYVADGISYENMPMAPIVGADATRAVLGRFLGDAKTVEWRIVRQIASGNIVANERIDRFELAGGWLELPVAGFFVVDDDGHIAIWRDYFDLASYTKQLAALTPHS
ncbi:MAG: limonene-1,2-epoxide hydrolase family protein [Acidimicrobiales bacterium]